MFNINYFRCAVISFFLIPITWNFTTLSALSDQETSLLLEATMQKYRVPGMAAAVIHDNLIVAQGVTGVRTKSQPEKLTSNDLFHIGSNAKSMTATLAALLVEQGVLNWHTKVIEVLPELAGRIHPDYCSLTLEQLVTHRGGLPANADYWKIQQSANHDLVKARRFLTEQVLSQRAATTPGGYLYSNVGFVIAGHMLERMMGRSWELLIKEKLFSPLGMSSVGFGPPGNPQTNSQPRGHKSTGESVVGPAADNPSMLGPAGTLHLSLSDWAKYVALHLQGARGNAQFLIPNSFEKLHHPISDHAASYAMGWFVTEYRGGKALSHSGTNTLWYATVWVIPSLNLAILVTCNQGGDAAAAAVNEAIQTLLQQCN